jgi:hypothetical protein
MIIILKLDFFNTGSNKKITVFTSNMCTLFGKKRGDDDCAC